MDATFRIIHDDQCGVRLQRCFQNQSVLAQVKCSYERAHSAKRHAAQQSRRRAEEGDSALQNVALEGCTEELRTCGPWHRHAATTNSHQNKTPFREESLLLNRPTDTEIVTSSCKFKFEILLKIRDIDEKCSKWTKRAKFKEE
jgi:hypothetical protein